MNFLPTILVFLGAIILAVHVGKHSVRHSLRQWCNMELGQIGEGTRAEGYREAIEKIQSSLKQRTVVFPSVKVEGEI
jgi:hypothetical protein